MSVTPIAVPERATTTAATISTQNALQHGSRNSAALMPRVSYLIFFRRMRPRKAKKRCGELTKGVAALICQLKATLPRELDVSLAGVRVIFVFRILFRRAAVSLGVRRPGMRSSVRARVHSA
jgi:hypothetical protein